MASDPFVPIDVFKLFGVLARQLNLISKSPWVRLILYNIIVDDSRLDLLAGHLISQFIEAGQLLWCYPSVREVQILVKL